MIHDLVSDSVFEDMRQEEIEREKAQNNPFLKMKPVPSHLGSPGLQYIFYHKLIYAKAF